MKFFDGINHPPAATVVADGLDGGMLYLGTPASGKDLTAAQYADYKAHKLFTVVGFEHVADDWRGGGAAGRANGAAFLADAKAKGVSLDDPFWVAGADQHVAASDLPTVVAYVKAYVATVRAGEWRGRAGGYGFPEVTTALHAAGVVDWYWGAGSRAQQPAFINIWQDNTQTIQVGGSADDVDWVLIPLPSTQEETVALTPADIAAVAHAVAAYKDPADPKDVDLHQHAEDATAALAQAKANGVQLAAIQGALSTRDAALLAAIQTAGQHVDVELAPDELAAVTAPITAVLTGLPAAVKLAIGQALVAPAASQ